MKRYEIRCYVNINSRKKDSFWYMYEHDLPNARACLMHAKNTVFTLASVDSNMSWLANCGKLIEEYIDKNSKMEHDFYIGRQIDGKYHYIFFKCYQTIR